MKTKLVYTLWGVVLFNCIILLFLFCCTNFAKKPPEVFDPHPKDNYISELDDQIHNFVYLIKEHKINPDCIETREKKCDAITMGTASGLVLSADESSIKVLTAAHFCQSNMPSNREFIVPEATIVGIVNDTPRELNKIAIDIENDLCLLTGPKYVDEDYVPITLAPELPKIGDKVYSVSAPNGIGGPGIRLVFEGMFGGCTGRMCMFTIPATFGSSGGGIYNEKGELVSIVMAVTEGFENVVFSPSYIELVNFIYKIDESVDIY